MEWQPSPGKKETRGETNGGERFKGTVAREKGAVEYNIFKGTVAREKREEEYKRQRRNRIDRAIRSKEGGKEGIL